MADNFNWGKSMTSDEVRNAAENLWRVENYRNRMPDRSLENTRVRMAEAEARYNAKQQNDRITMLESQLKSANDAINRLSETQKLIQHQRQPMTTQLKLLNITKKKYKI